MEQDFERLSVSSQDDELCDTAVKSFGSFIGTFLQLLVLASLLNKVQDRVCELSIGQRPGFSTSICHLYDN